MNKFCKTLLGAIVAVGTASGAHAADTTMAYEQGGFDWSGAYVALFLGHTFGGDLDTDPRHVSTQTSSELDGFLAGIGGGYRWQLDNDVVFGVGVAVPVWAEEGRMFTGGIGDLAFADPQFGYSINAQLGRAYGRFLPYVHAGLGHTWVEGGSITSGTSQTNAHLVATVGAGLGYQINEYFNTRVQYNYFHASAEDYTDIVNAGAGFSNDYGWSGHSVFFVLEYSIPNGGLFN